MEDRAVSLNAVIATIYDSSGNFKNDFDQGFFADKIRALPPVTPCKDAISRQAVLEQTYNWSKDEFLRVTNPFHYLRKRINSLPFVNPQEPKMGHWIAYEVRLPDRTILNYKCSVCGRRLIGYNTETLSEAPFCHCGAKMSEIPTGSEPQERSRANEK